MTRRQCLIGLAAFPLAKYLSPFVLSPDPPEYNIDACHGTCDVASVIMLWNSSGGACISEDCGETWFETDIQYLKDKGYVEVW